MLLVSFSNRKVLHFQSPGAVITAITTFIASSRNTVKRILLVPEGILPAGLPMSLGVSR